MPETRSAGDNFRLPCSIRNKAVNRTHTDRNSSGDEPKDIAQAAQYEPGQVPGSASFVIDALQLADIAATA